MRSRHRPRWTLRRVRVLAEAAIFFVTEALTGFRRNGLMTAAAVTTVLVALLTVGTAMVLGINVRHLASVLEAQVEIVAFLKDGLTVPEVDRVRRAVSAVSAVQEVRFVSRAEALVRLQQQLGDAALADLAAQNPLPDSLEIRVTTPGDVASIAAAIGRVAGVEEVTYGSQVAERLAAVTRGLRLVAALLTLFLVGVALLVVVNTIRLTVIARREEIEIMRLVGATRWFIRWPFLLEGAGQGAVAAIGAGAVLLPLYLAIAARLAVSLPFLPVVPPVDVLRPALLAILTAGLVVGGSGSLIAVRRFLST